MQCGIGRALQGLRQAGVTDQPHGDQVARVEREVEEGREVAEEFRRQVLCFVDDPQRRQLLAVDQLVYPVLDVAPQLRTAVGRLDAQGARQATVAVGTAEGGFRQVDEPEAKGVEGTRKVAQRSDENTTER